MATGWDVAGALQSVTSGHLSHDTCDQVWLSLVRGTISSLRSDKQIRFCYGQHWGERLTVGNEVLSKDSSGTVHRGTFDGKPCAVKMCTMLMNPLEMHEYVQKHVLPLIRDSGMLSSEAPSEAPSEGLSAVPLDVQIFPPLDSIIDFIDLYKQDRVDAILSPSQTVYMRYFTKWPQQIFIRDSFFQVITVLPV